jgi:hypothetical protein
LVNGQGFGLSGNQLSVQIGTVALLSSASTLPGTGFRLFLIAANPVV